MWFTQCQSFSSYTHVFPLALNASKVRPQYWYSKKGKNIQFYTFAFSWTGSEFDCIWILLFEGWILPEGGSQSLWRLQCLDGIPTGRPSQARGGQQIPLAHSQAFLELQCKKTAPLVRIAQCSTECYMYMSCLRWEPQGPWPFSRPALLVFRVCWWTVQLSISSLLFKALSHLCLTDLRFFFPFFCAMSTPALHLVSRIQKQTVLMCSLFNPLLHVQREAAPSLFAAEIRETYKLRPSLGFAGYPKSRSLVFFLNGRVCSASRLLQCFPCLVRCMYKTLQPSSSSRCFQVCTF